MASLGQLILSSSGTALNSWTPPLLNHSRTPTKTRNFQVKMSIPPIQASTVPPENRIVLGCGAVSVDFLAAVASYPKPDDKIRSTSFEVQGGGNTGNALTCAARLGLTPRMISKVADDSQGKGILEELETDGVDTSFIAVGEGGNSPFTYIIVDSQTKTRTCIHTPGYPPMMPTDLSRSKLLSALDGAKIVYFDGRLHETAAIVAEEANRRGIPILIDAERKREGLDNLLSFANYVVCSTKFPQDWTEASSIPSALVSMLIRLPNVKFVIVTLGADGCIMLQRTRMAGSPSETVSPPVNGRDNLHPEEMDVDDLFERLNQEKDTSATLPACMSSNETKLHAKGIGTISGKLLVGTAEGIPQMELIDTTGAGDAFIGAVLYSICANISPEEMLPFAAQVAAIKCRALGARAGLPRYTDPRLTPFLL